MLRTEQISKSYHRQADRVQVLKGVDFSLDAKEFVSIVGASGSGKSTFLHLLGTLDVPDSGRIYLDNERIDTLRGKARDRLRNQTFGFVFQFYHLLPELTALDNILMAAYVRHSFFSWWQVRREWKKRAEQMLERVGLAARKNHKPSELSGGEMQRAAVARALLAHPKILLADEPTGNLDADTGNEIMTLLHDLNRHDAVTILMVTHNLEMASTTDRVLKMTKGHLEDYSATMPVSPFAFSLAH